MIKGFISSEPKSFIDDVEKEWSEQDYVTKLVVESPIPLNDEQKQKYDKIGPGTTAQVALYVSQYNLGVGTGCRLTPAAINIKNFIPFGSQANTAEDWGFTVDAPQQGSGTPSTNDFDF